MAVWFAACGTEPGSDEAPGAFLKPSVELRQTETNHETARFAAVRRVGLELRAEGKLQTGHPFRIVTKGVGNRAARDIHLTVALPDGGEWVASGGRPRVQEARWGNLPRGGQQALANPVMFREPGYYRVIVRSVSQGEPGLAAADDSMQIAETEETLWIYLTDKDGAITAGYDPTLITAAGGFRDGAYGPSLGLGWAGGVGPASFHGSSNTPTIRLASASAAAAYSYGLNVTYRNSLTGTDVPVPFAFIQSQCVVYNPYPVTTLAYNGPTDANGHVDVSCPSLYPILQGTVAFSSANVNVQGQAGAAVGSFMFSSGQGGQYGVKVANDPAAHVYTVLRNDIPLGFAKFGRTRSAITVYVSTTDPSYGIFYDPDVDRILMNYTRVFSGSGGQDGYFVINHEYGHAFQFKAIEPWAVYSCNGNSHSINVANLLQCAFVEGFADFYSGWVGGARLTTGWSGGFLTDNALEANPWRGLGDGARIEGSVAAFFYDLVDGTGEPDGASNTADGEESFDGATYPGLYVADVLRTCGFNTGLPGAVTKLDGIDQFIYCAERSLTGRTLGTGFRLYSSFTESATEPGSWNTTMVRRLWRYNLYNVAP